MRRLSLHPAHPAGRVNVTPMIDVVMCLIVFFLIVGRLAAEQRTPVALPRAQSGEKEREAGQVFVTVTAGEGGALRVRIDGADVPEEEALAAVRERAGHAAAVHLRAERSLPFGRVREFVEACRDAGVSEVRLGTERTP